VAPGELLPPVFPLVLYNGSGRWTAARDIADLIVPLPTALARYRPQQRYHLIDEGRVEKATLAQATSVAAELVRLEVLAADGPAAVRPILQRLTARLRDPRHASLRRALTVWFARVLLRRLMPGENLPELHDLTEVETMLAERVDEWTQKWKREGLLEGKREGKREGQLEGQREGKLEGKREGKTEALQSVLTARFGPLPSWVGARLAGATVDQLDAWLNGVLQTETLEGLLGDPPVETVTPAR
jgi:hypothetical protein